MPVPLPHGKQIIVHYGVYEEQYQMKSMQMSTDHYNIGITLQGCRRTVTPNFSYCYQAGDVALAPPYLLHRTVPESNGPYERIMVKFSYKFAEPFIREMGQEVFERLYENYVYYFTPETQDKIRHLFFDMYEEYQKNTPYREFILQGMLFRLFTIIMEEHLPIEVTMYPSSLTPQILDAINYMEKYYQTNIAMEEVAHNIGFSPSYFSRLFHAQLGMSYRTYLSNIQIRNVQLLLANTDLSVSDIAKETGYVHVDYLSAQFKKKTGMTPSQYRKQSALGLLPS